ncbi:MAG: HAD-IA family hydrolase [Acidobacteriota bacterium]|nr:HAD-IA family hydrolase [Blastocatellia bacterium]MDW8413421.1 HAD-IA family hydrolase [Acidobacteriota bacterium]
MKDIKAVIFDYGQVLSCPQPLQAIKSMADICQVPIERFHERYYRYRREYDTNLLDAKAYWEAVAGFPLSMPSVAELVDIDNQSWAHENRPITAWAKLLRRRGFKTAILSNMPKDMLEALPLLCPWLPKVDVAIYSCELGIAKPEVIIYQKVLESLAVAPHTALFLDDKKINTDAALLLGMQAIVFDSNSSVAARLKEFDLPAIDLAAEDLLL